MITKSMIMTTSTVINIATAILTFMITVMNTIPTHTITSTSTGMNTLTMMTFTITVTNVLMTTSTAIVTNMGTIMNMDALTSMGIVMATGTRRIFMIRNTRRSLIAAPRGFALILPRSWLKCSSCKAMSGFSMWRQGPVAWLGRWRSGSRAAR